MSVQKSGKSIEYPVPDQGWSRGYKVVENAVVSPPSGDFGAFPICGVYGPDGDEATAAHWRDNVRVCQPIDSPPLPDENLPGMHFFGGFVYGHFGHFLLESTSRLWLTDVEKPESILFIPRRETFKSIKPFQKDILNILIPGIPVRLLQYPVSVEKLVVPGQGFGLGSIVKGTPEFKNMVKQRLEKIDACGPKKIYISRTKYQTMGSVLNEEVLEENLAQYGYDVMYPEKMSVREQLAWYKSATHIVGMDCSALHLSAFASNPMQKTAIILRRNTHAYHQIFEQIQGMSGNSPTVINSLVNQWMAGHLKQGNHKSYGELDFKETGELLREEGFIENTDKWRAPTSEEHKASISRCSQYARMSLVRRPVDIRVGPPSGTVVA